MDEKQFFDKARQVAKAIDQGEYKVCSLEEAEAFAEKRKASAYKLADEVMEHYNAEKQKRFNVNWMQEVANMLRQQQNEIEDLINAHRFVQNFAEEQHQRAVALESELDRAVELYTDKAIENEALHRFIDERGEIGQLIIWKAQEK